eukprot:284815677_4
MQCRSDSCLRWSVSLCGITARKNLVWLVRLGCCGICSPLLGEKHYGGVGICRYIIRQMTLSIYLRDEEKGKPCQAKNFLLAFAVIPEVRLCRILPDPHDSASGTALSFEGTAAVVAGHSFLIRMTNFIWLHAGQLRFLSLQNRSFKVLCKYFSASYYNICVENSQTIQRNLMVLAAGRNSKLTRRMNLIQLMGYQGVLPVATLSIIYLAVRSEQRRRVLEVGIQQQDRLRLLSLIYGDPIRRSYSGCLKLLRLLRIPNANLPARHIVK